MRYISYRLTCGDNEYDAFFGTDGLLFAFEKQIIFGSIPIEKAIQQVIDQMKQSCSSKIKSHSATNNDKSDGITPIYVRYCQEKDIVVVSQIEDYTVSNNKLLHLGYVSGIGWKKYLKLDENDYKAEQNKTKNILKKEM